MRLKLLVSFFFSGFLLVSTTSDALATLLTIEPDGEIVWNVLSEEVALETPKHSYIEVKKVGDEGVNNKSEVLLSKEDGKISLVVSSANETRELNVSSQNQDLIEVEERPEIQKIVIGILDNKFYIEQKGVSAVTDYTVNVDAESANISIQTPTGKRFLSILPRGAVDSLLRTRLVNKLSSKTTEIQEKDGEIQYKIDGIKVFELFNLYSYEIPVTAFVSASTGEVLALDSPTWFKYVGFLFM